MSTSVREQKRMAFSKARVGRPRTSRRDERGAVTVEYVVLLAAVSVGLALSVAALGPHLVGSYVRARDTVSSPFP